MAVISLLAILLTTGLLTGVYQNLLCRQVISDLREYVLLVREEIGRASCRERV